MFMLDGAGHRLTNRHSGRKPNDLQTLAALSGLVPIVTLVLGPAAGHSALCGAARRLQRDDRASLDVHAPDRRS